MSTIKQLDTTNFDSDVLASEKPALVDFWAPWCGPCRLVGPTIENVSEQFGASVTVGKLNVDDSPDLANDYGITAIPSVLVFKDGKVVDRLVGVQPLAAYESALKQFVA